MKYQSKVRMFKSDTMEKFTHVHPILPLLVWGPVAGYFLWQAWVTLGLVFWWKIAVGFLAGLFFWTLTEYLLHRFVFHWVNESAAGRRFHFLVHGVHHEDPNDPTRLVMPPILAVLLAIPLYSFYRMILGPVWILPFFSGFLVGYLCYDYTHYAVHHFKQRTRVGKYLKKFHMDHHFAEMGAKWGVSSPLWDIVFGTVEERRTSSRTRKSHS